MPNYKKMYFHMFNRITDIIEETENNNSHNVPLKLARVVEQLKQLQFEGEDMYIDTYDEFPEED